MDLLGPSAPDVRLQQWHLDIRKALTREESALPLASRSSAKDAAAVGLVRAIAASILGPDHTARDFPSDKPALSDELITDGSALSSSHLSTDSTFINLARFDESRTSSGSLTRARPPATSPFAARSHACGGPWRVSSSQDSPERPSALFPAPSLGKDASVRSSGPAADASLPKSASWRADGDGECYPDTAALDLSLHELVKTLAARRMTYDSTEGGGQVVPLLQRRASLPAPRPSSDSRASSFAARLLAPTASLEVPRATSSVALPPLGAEQPASASADSAFLLQPCSLDDAAVELQGASARPSDADGPPSKSIPDDLPALKADLSSGLPLTLALGGGPGGRRLALMTRPSIQEGEPDGPWSVTDILKHGYSTLCAVACQWDLINSFKLDQILQQKSLIIMGYTLVQRNRALDALGIDFSKLLNFLSCVHELYTDAPYHNSRHATHVVWAAHALLHATKMAYIMQPLEMMAMYVAAIAHDIGHRGTSSVFQFRTRSRSTLIYDQSPIEKCHLALTSLLVDLAENGFLENLSVQERTAFLALIRRLVLGTDIALHDQIVGEWRSRLDRLKVLAQSADEASTRARGLASPLGLASSCRVSDADFEAVAPPGAAPVRLLHHLDTGAVSDRELVLMMLLKCADLSHAAIKTSIHLCWVARLEEEVWCQGDMERALGLTIGEVNDRCSGKGLQSTQVGFFNGFVLPLYAQFGDVFPDTLRVLRLAQANHQYWVDRAEASAFDAAQQCCATGEASPAEPLLPSATSSSGIGPIPPRGTGVLGS